MLDVFKYILEFGLSMLGVVPELNFNIPSDVVSSATFILTGVAYFLPMGSIVALFTVKCSVVIFRCWHTS